MRYETYICGKADNVVEYGFCFKEDDEGADDCIAPDLVIGETRKHGKIPGEWEKWEWMAKAVCAAAPATVPEWDSN